MSFGTAGLIVLAAVLCSLGGRDRRDLFCCAVVFALDWLWYSAAWAPLSPAQFLADLSVKAGHLQLIQPAELWATGDAFAAAYVLTRAGDRYWGAALFGLYLASIVLYIDLDYGGGNSGPILTLLNFLFLAEAFILIAVGGSGIVDRLLHYLSDRGLCVSPYLTRALAKVDQRQEVRFRRRETLVLRDMITQGRTRDAKRYLDAKLRK